MGSPVATDDLVMLDITDPALDPNGPEIRAARAAHWCARTPMGLAVLRHDKLTMLLGDRRLVQGSHRILTAQGLTTGPLVEWMNTMILSMEGDDHLRVRRLVSRAFTPRAVTALRPRMCEIAHELVDGFPAGGGGTVEFMAAFADPFPARVICELLGVPPDLQETVRGWANDLGLAFSYTAAANLERIEAALAPVFAATDRLLAARRARPPTTCFPRCWPPRPTVTGSVPTSCAASSPRCSSPGRTPPATSSGWRWRCSCAIPTSGRCWPPGRSSRAGPSRRSSGSRRRPP